MGVNKWLKRNTQSLAGRTAAVSGSTGGIGKELCRILASLGAHLILIDRNREKSEALGNALKAEFQGVKIGYITADMSDMESVKRAADELLLTDVHYLILNAGAYAIPRKTCDTGYDNVFQINFISPYYLARRLFPLISERGGRIVAVSSIAHNYSKTNPLDIDFSENERASRVYGNSKRFLTYSLLNLYGESGVLSVSHPGISFTGITNHYPRLIFFIIKYPMKVIFMRPKKAALSVVKGIFTPTKQYEWIGPRLFNVWGLPKKRRLATADVKEIEFITAEAEKIYAKFI